MSLLIASIIGFSVLSFAHRPAKWQEPKEMLYYGDDEHQKAFHEAFKKKNRQFDHYQF